LIIAGERGVFQYLSCAHGRNNALRGRINDVVRHQPKKEVVLAARMVPVRGARTNSAHKLKGLMVE